MQSVGAVGCLAQSAHRCPAEVHFDAACQMLRYTRASASARA